MNDRLLPMRTSSPARHLAGVALACMACVAHPAKAVPPVESVPKVEVPRYAGRWFELARLPNRFQDRCVGDVTADYTQEPDASLTVLNRCRTAAGEWQSAEGRATRVPDVPSGAQLKVSFLPRWMQWFPLGRGDYWVVLLDPQYRYTVVSEPSREFLWILSRTPSLDDAIYQGILGRLQVAGYPVERLVQTPQSGRDDPDEPAGPRTTRP
jgi:apolipoprotein D and lipocalin family protein